jgi:integrase
MNGVKSPSSKKLEQEQQASREERTMTPDQVMLFLHEAKATRFGTIFTLAFYTGCRPGELLGLRWDDLDSQSRVIKIRHTIHWRKGSEWYLETPKTIKGRRNLRLTDELIAMLDQHRKRQLEERIKAGGAWQNHNFIFCDEIGNPYRQGILTYRFKQILESTGLPKHFNPYSGRHTIATRIATRMIEQGIDPKTVSEWLGHANVAITLKTYTHPTGSMHEAASEQAEALIRGQK